MYLIYLDVICTYLIWYLKHFDASVLGQTSTYWDVLQRTLLYLDVTKKGISYIHQLKKARLVRWGCTLQRAGGKDRIRHQTMTKPFAMNARPRYPYLDVTCIYWMCWENTRVLDGQTPISVPVVAEEQQLVHFNVMFAHLFSVLTSGYDRMTLYVINSSQDSWHRLSFQAEELWTQFPYTYGGRRWPIALQQKLGL
jgi:hypothetical protein